MIGLVGILSQKQITTIPVNGIAVTDFQYLIDITDDGQGNLTGNVDGNGGVAALAFYINANEGGFISQRYILPYAPGEYQTAMMSMGIGIDPHFGRYDGLTLQAQNDGQLIFGLIDEDIIYTPNVIYTNALLRLRVDATTAYIEYCNATDYTFTIIAQQPRPAGQIRFKIAISDGAFICRELKSYKQNI